MTDVTSADFSVVVYREDDAWEAELLPTALTENLEGLIHALRQQPSIGGTIGLAAVGDDFFVALRVVGSQVSVFLSDLTASVDWHLARQVLDYLDIPVPDEDEDLDQVLPADLGIDEMDLGALSGDLDIFPDEALESIARRLGFETALKRALDGVLGLCPPATFRRSSRPCAWRSIRPLALPPGTTPRSRSVPSSWTQRGRWPGRAATARRRTATPRRTPRSWPSGRRRPRAATGGWTGARWSSRWNRARCARGP